MNKEVRNTINGTMALVLTILVSFHWEEPLNAQSQTFGSSELPLVDSSVVLVGPRSGGQTRYGKAIAPNTSASINKFGVAWIVNNNCQNSVLVPTDSADQWKAFVGHYPACVTLTKNGSPFTWHDPCGVNPVYDDRGAIVGYDRQCGEGPGRDNDAIY